MPFLLGEEASDPQTGLRPQGDSETHVTTFEHRVPRSSDNTCPSLLTALPGAPLSQNRLSSPPVASTHPQLCLVPKPSLYLSPVLWSCSSVELERAWRAVSGRKPLCLFSCFPSLLLPITLASEGVRHPGLDRPGLQITVFLGKTTEMGTRASLGGHALAVQHAPGTKELVAGEQISSKPIQSLRMPVSSSERR